jgi:futalosine hydrolase
MLSGINALCYNSMMPVYKTIGLISAVSFESAIVRKKLKSEKRSPFPVYAGTVGRVPIVHMESGIGVTNAAHASTLLIEKYSASKVILFGIGGAYPGQGLNIGDIAFAEIEIYADLGVHTKNGHKNAEDMDIPLLVRKGNRLFNEFPMDRRLLGKALKAFKGNCFKTGAFLTVCEVTGTAARARELQGRYNALCENMEGAAVAHVCTRYGVPALEVRGISNIVEDRDPGRWQKKSASEKCQGVVLKLLDILQR